MNIMMVLQIALIIIIITSHNESIIVMHIFIIVFGTVVEKGIFIILVQ
jgi:hypothetical protein